MVKIQYNKIYYNNICLIWKITEKNIEKNIILKILKNLGTIMMITKRTYYNMKNYTTNRTEQQ